MRITKWGEYGILCSLYLVEKQEKDSTNDLAIGASEISEDLGIPIQYTQQILQRLRKGNIIASVRGPKGGYKLAQEAVSITLKDVIYAAEGDTFEVICEHHPISSELCSSESFCGLKEIWYELKETVDNFLSQKTLADVAKDHSVRFPHRSACTTKQEELIPTPTHQGE